MKTLMACVLITLVAVEAHADKPTVLLAASTRLGGPATAWLRDNGYRVVPVVNEYRAFNRQFFGIDETIPSWADDALRADWTKGSEACQAQVGPPPYGGKPQAIFCGQSLMAALWQRHLDRLAPGGIVLLLSENKRKEGSTFTGSIHDVGAESQRHLSRELGPEVAADGVAVELCRRLLAGEGEYSKREVVRMLPARPAGAPPASEQVAQFPAVPLSRCARLPVSLKISPESSASRALAARWKLSVEAAGATGAERSCELKYRAGPVSFAGTTMAHGTGALECEGDAFSATESEFDNSGVLRSVTAKLIEQAAKKWCE